MLPIVVNRIAVVILLYSFYSLIKKIKTFSLKGVRIMMGRKSYVFVIINVSKSHLEGTKMGHHGSIL